MTTTDIARMDANAPAVLDGANAALERLGQWVTAAKNATQLVSPLVDTAFVPDAYRPKVDPRATDKEKEAAYRVAIANATAAVLQGITLGLDPLTALQQIYIVHGRPGMYTEMKVALLKSRGHEVWVEDLTDTRAVVCGRRNGTDYVERVVVTMDQARKAGWTKNDNYSKTPQDMLYARAAGRVCDRVAPDVLMGIASVEEIQDTIQATAEVGNATRTVTPRKRAAAVTAGPGVVEEPSLDDDVTVTGEVVSQTQAEPDLDDTPPASQAKAKGITAASSKRMYGLLSQYGMGEKDDALKYIASVTGHEVASTKDLSEAEAREVIYTLDRGGPASAEPVAAAEGEGEAAKGGES